MKETLKCASCQNEKELDEFRIPPKGNITSINVNGRWIGVKVSKPQCRDCRLKTKRAKVLEAKYGITQNEYDEMFDQQKGLCAACGNPPGKKKLVVDHCHNSGKVRGLLHFECNIGLGLAKENPIILDGWINYLTKHTTAEMEPYGDRG